MRLLVLLLWSPCLWAGVIHSYSLELLATAGPLSGQSGGGTFSFEAPEEIPSYRTVSGVPFVHLDMTWNGIRYTEADLPTWGWSQHLPDGRLDLEFGTGRFGTGCSPGRCSLPGIGEEFNISFIFLQDGGLEDFITYTLPDGTNDRWQGTALFTYLGTVESVPEPSTLALLSLGIAILGLRRGRARFRCAGGFAGLSRP